jgi:hypothetical protein
MTVLWGLGPVGISAFIYLIIKRKITFYEWSLLIGNVIAIFVSMRYAVNQGYSPHYYIFAALLGVWFIAQSYKIIDENSRGKNYRRFIPVVTIFLIVAVYSVHLYSRVHPLKIHYDPEVTKLGYKLKEFIEPGNLVIVRSIAEEKERGEWGDRINNYEDPRIFYIANVKGWPLPSDYKGAALIARYAALGANYYAEPFNRKSDEERYDWLNTHGKLVFESDYGRIYKLYKN